MFEFVAALLLFVPVVVALVSVQGMTDDDDDDEVPTVEAWMSDFGYAWVMTADNQD